MASDDYATKVHIELTENQRFVATFPDLPGVAAITVDEAPPLGRAAGPNPAALLAAAVGNCLAASLLFDRRWAAGKDVRCPHNQAYDASRTETKTRYRQSDAQVCWREMTTVLEWHQEATTRRRK
jgi:uncharacterized OsmC-like protein